MNLIYSAHIPYGKGKYLNQTIFFYKICRAPNLYLTSRVLPLEFKELQRLNSYSSRLGKECLQTSIEKWLKIVRKSRKCRTFWQFCQ